MHVTYSASAIYNTLVKKYRSGRDGTTMDMIKNVQADYATGDLTYRNYIRYISILLAKSPERHNHVPIDMPVTFSGSSGEMTFLSDNGPLANLVNKATLQQPETERDLSLKSLIERMLNRLDKEEQNIVIMYYGLSGNEPHTYEKLAEKIKCSKQRIHQQHKKIVVKLRNYLKEIGQSDKIDPREFLE
jgi:RNA polymerase sigma factor (sigma-70 family)